MMRAKRQSKAVHMGCHITSGPSLTLQFGCRGLKLLFGVGAYLSSLGCAGKGRRTHPAWRLLPAEASWRRFQPVPAEGRGQGASVAPPRLLLHLQVPDFPSVQGCLWGRVLGGSRRQRKILGAECCKGETCDERVLQKQSMHFCLIFCYVTLGQHCRNQ